MIIDSIKKDWSEYVVSKCRGKSRKCSMRANTDVPNVALNCDALKDHSAFEALYSQNGSVNDCMLMELDDVLYVGVIEFKTKSGYDTSKAIKQLLAGRRIAVSLLSKYTLRKKCDIYLILIACNHNNSAKKTFYRELRRLDKHKSKVIMTNCTDTFKNARKRIRDF